MQYSGAGGKLIHQKNQKQKISWHYPLKFKQEPLLQISCVIIVKQSVFAFLKQKTKVWNLAIAVSLKGLYHKMDLAFDDMYGQF